MDKEVCAVVVTYNRCGLLRRCLASLAAQARTPSEILVVDNASTDETAAMLESEFPHLRVLRMSYNSGGAGGFHAGIQWAYENGYHWIWVMDDDVEMFPGTLQVMLRYGGLSGFIHVRKEVPDGVFRWEGLWDLSAAEKRSFPEDISFRHGRQWIPVNYGNFEGALIRRDVVARIGYPDPRFFIHGDDLVYGYLASFHTNVIYLNHVGLRRLTPFAGRGPRRYYFQFRNRFLVYEYLARTGASVSRAAFWFQNLLTMHWCLRVSEHGFRDRWRALAAMLGGLRDGVAGHFGPPPA